MTIAIALALLAILALEAVPRILKLNPRWETPPMEIRRRMAAVRRALAILITLTLAGTAHAQSTYDWTLGNDSRAPCACAALTGAGIFTTSSQSFESIETGGNSTFPITSLSGQLNGAPVSLASPPNGIGNLYYVPSLPIPWFAPLYMASAGGVWTLSQLGVAHPGTGQLVTAPDGTVTYVSFTATAAVPVSPQVPFGTRLPPVLSSSGPVMPWKAATAPARRSLSPVVIEVSVPAAIALGVGVYEWIHHRERGRRDAVPAGKAL